MVGLRRKKFKLLDEMFIVLADSGDIHGDETKIDRWTEIHVPFDTESKALKYAGNQANFSKDPIVCKVIPIKKVEQVTKITDLPE